MAGQGTRLRLVVVLDLGEGIGELSALARLVHFVRADGRLAGGRLWEAQQLQVTKH